MQPSITTPAPPRPAKKVSIISPNMPLAQIAARIDHDDVARLRRVEHVPVQLRLGILVFGFVVEVFALGHALQGQRGTGDRAALDQRPGPSDLRVAYAELP